MRFITLPQTTSLLIVVLCSFAAGQDEPTPTEPLREVQQARKRGLAALARAQERKSGAWRAHVGYRTEQSDGYTISKPDVPHVGVSALVLEAFLVTGFPKGDHAAVVRRGLDFLLKCQDPDDGYVSAYRTRMSSHGLALVTLVRAHVLTEDEKFARAASRAARFSARSQGSREGGWGYLPFHRKINLLETTFQCLALREAQKASLEVPLEVITRAQQAIARHWTDTTHEASWTEEVRSGPRFLATIRNHGPSSVVDNAAALLAIRGSDALTADQWKRTRDKVLADWPAFEEESSPQRPAMDHYGTWLTQLYVAKLLKAESGTARGRRVWQEFRTKLHARLIASQRPSGTWRNAVGPGPMFSTAIACTLLGL